MDYQNIHDQIISRAKSREKPDCYCERHHIIPRSMGGADDDSNLVFLTAREHFLIHWILKKIHNNKEMIFAFFKMTHQVGNGRTRYTSHSFKYAKEALGKWISENRSGENHPFYGMLGESHPHFGMKRKKSTREKISIAAKERFKTQENPKSKPVICIDNGMIFRSALEAGRYAGKGNIQYAIKNGGTAGGLRFKYIAENQECLLKGYAKGENHIFAKKVKDSNGNLFNTIKDAARHHGVSGTAISIAIKQNRSCKGIWYEIV